MNLAEFHERVCEPPLAQGEEKVRVTAVLLCFDKIRTLGLDYNPALTQVRPRFEPRFEPRFNPGSTQVQPRF